MKHCVCRCESGEWKWVCVHVLMCIGYTVWKHVCVCRCVAAFYLGRWSIERGSVCFWRAPPPHDTPPHNAHTGWANFHGWREERCCCCFLHKDLTGTELREDQKHVTYCHCEALLFVFLSTEFKHLIKVIKDVEWQKKDKGSDAFLMQVSCYQNMWQLNTSFNV